MSPLDPSMGTQTAGNMGMAGGAQLVPLAQQLAQRISSGQVAAPDTFQGWQNLVAQFSSKGDLPTGTTDLAKLGSQPSSAVTGTSQGTSATTSGANDPNGIDAFLGAVKQHESGGNYGAYNAAGGASGAYQYIQSTWSSMARDAGFTQYANGPASAAPPDVQDAVAKYNAEQLYKQSGSWKTAAESWYYPAWAQDPSKQNSVPYPSAGNTMTIGGYGDQIVSMMGKGGQAPVQGAAVSNMGSGSAISYARGQIGTPYQWGGEQAGVGFDCSGLVQAAFKSAGVNLPRTAQAQYDATMKVQQGQPLQAGDLVFFGQDTSHITHVGIYAGNGQMIDAPHSGAQVRTESYQWGDYVGATRPTDHTAISQMPKSVQANYSGVLSQVMNALNSLGAK